MTEMPLADGVAVAAKSVFLWIEPVNFDTHYDERLLSNSIA